MRDAGPTRYVALLRGINVGGRNLIRMTELKACFEKHGFQSVHTYIQSGNVIFTAEASPASGLTRRIEAVLEATFGYRSTVMLRTRRQMQAIVRRAPDGFGEDPASYRYDVVFLKPPLTVRAALQDVPTRAGVDQVYGGSGVLYFSRLASRASASQFARLVALPIYQSMTIRNWNTTTALARLLNESDG